VAIQSLHNETYKEGYQVATIKPGKFTWHYIG